MAAGRRVSGRSRAGCAAAALVRAFVLALGLATAAGATELAVLSAGAIEPGVRPALVAFERESGHSVKLSFATAPQIRARIDAGERFDVVMAPPALLDEFAQQGKVPADAAERAPVGRVGLGVAVRAGVPVPDISNADAVRRALLEADSLVYNRASTGLYFEGLLKQMGIDAQVAAKTTRYPDGASVMHHVLQGQGREIGVGAITEIVLLRAQGLQLVGPLPAPLQNFTAYAAVPMAGSANASAVSELLAHLRRSDTRAALVAAGIAP